MKSKRFSLLTFPQAPAASTHPHIARTVGQLERLEALRPAAIGVVLNLINDLVAEEKARFGVGPAS